MKISSGNNKMKNSKNKYQLDFIETPFIDFILVKDMHNNSNRLISHPNTINGSSQLNELCEKHIEELARKHPDFYLESFNIKYIASVDFEGGRLGDYIKKEKIEDFLVEVEKVREKTIRENPRLADLIKKEEIDSYAKNHFLFGVWEQAIKQHIDNKYYCEEKFSPNRFKIEENIVKIAEDDSSYNNGHGNFEIKVFKILSKTQKDKVSQMYTVSTLEIEQIKTVFGQGCYDFEDKF